MPRVISPVAEAAALCHANGGNFKDELEAHLLNGFVFSTPDAFLMGRPVPRGAEVRDVWQTWPIEQCDAWFVWWGSGSAYRLLSLMPYELPWIGWARAGRHWRETSWIPTALLRRRLKRF